MVHRTAVLVCQEAEGRTVLALPTARAAGTRMLSSLGKSRRLHHQAPDNAKAAPGHPTGVAEVLPGSLFQSDVP